MGANEHFARDQVRREALQFGRDAAMRLLAEMKQAGNEYRWGEVPEDKAAQDARIQTFIERSVRMAQGRGNVVYTGRFFKPSDEEKGTAGIGEVYVAMVVPNPRIPDTYDIFRIQQEIRPRSVTVMTTSAFLSVTAHLAQRMVERSNAVNPLRRVGEGMIESAAYLALGTRIWTRESPDEAGRYRAAIPFDDGMALGWITAVKADVGVGTHMEASGRSMEIRTREAPNRLRPLTDDSGPWAGNAFHFTGMTFVGPDQFFHENRVTDRLLKRVIQENPVTRLLGYQMLWPDSTLIREAVRLSAAEIGLAHAALLRAHKNGAVRHVFRQPPLPERRPVWRVTLSAEDQREMFAEPEDDLEAAPAPGM